MNVSTAIFVSISTVLTGAISALVAYLGQSRSAVVTQEGNRLDHNEALLEGYSQMVDDLRGEVSRLKDIINEMRIEQDECDRKNRELLKEVVQLKLRIGQLEKR
jgi:peptidoglycan hydrolase CwlO-like protein